MRMKKILWALLALALVIALPIGGMAAVNPDDYYITGSPCPSCSQGLTIEQEDDWGHRVYCSHCGMWTAETGSSFSERHWNSNEYCGVPIKCEACGVTFTPDHTTEYIKATPHKRQ